MAAEREHGTTTTFVVRYPDGSSEFRMSRLAPQVGDVLTGRGDRWLVAEVAEKSRGNVAIVLQRREPDA
jgi:hypothetical protein